MIATTFKNIKKLLLILKACRKVHFYHPVGSDPYLIIDKLFEFWNHIFSPLNISYCLRGTDLDSFSKIGKLNFSPGKNGNKNLLYLTLLSTILA